MGVEPTNYKAIAPWNPNTPNADIIAAIQYDASPQYQDRIPGGIKADVQQTLDRLNNYRPGMNEFVEAYVNKIGLQIARGIEWNNPLSIYKKGNVVLGDTVEEAQVGLIRGYQYDPRREYGEKALFGKNIPEVATSYHTVNREQTYPLTMQKSTLQRAFNTEDGLAQLISQMMSSLTTSDELDEFLLMCQLFPEYERNGGFFKVHVDDVSAPDSTEASAKYAARVLREYAQTLTFISRHYNAAGMEVAAKAEDLILITTPQFQSGMDVNALAAAFNTSYMDIPQRTHVVPQEHLGIAGAQGIITTKDFFQVYDTYFDTEVQANPAGRYYNTFLHHDQIISASRFVPALMLTTGEGDVITISDRPVESVNDIVIKDKTGANVTDVVRGESYIVEGGAVTEGDNDATQLILSGTLSNHSYLAQSGTFHVAVDEESNELKITSKATDDNSKTKVRAVKVVGDRVQFWPNPQVHEDADNDGLVEVTPQKPAFADNKITVPNSDKVEYKDGATVVNGTVVTITADKTITATAKSGFEIKPGATASWVYTFTA